MRISDWSSDVCSSDLGLCQRHFAALAPHSGGKVGDSNGAVKAVKLDDPVDQRSRSGYAKQFVAQGPEVAAGIVAQQLVELLPHALDRSEEHTSELQSLMRISYAVFCLKKNKTKHKMSKHTK